jgi:hypothetical protein
MGQLLDSTAVQAPHREVAAAHLGPRRPRGAARCARGRARRPARLVERVLLHVLRRVECAMYAQHTRR